MRYVVVPVMNEEEKILLTIEELTSTVADKILLVANGCNEMTYDIVNALTYDKVETIYFNEALGYDVPRAIGAYYAYTDGAEYIAFIDGDMQNISVSVIDELFYRLSQEERDMVLIQTIDNSGINKEKNILASYIRQLNSNLSIYSNIGYATPSIGPHGISRKLIDTIGYYPLAIPPLSLALATKSMLDITAPINLPINVVADNIKDELHAQLIMDTIIGDCIYSWHYYTNEHNPNRKGYLGYHNSRRLDLLSLVTDMLS